MRSRRNIIAVFSAYFIQKATRWRCFFYETYHWYHSFFCHNLLFGSLFLYRRRRHAHARAFIGSITPTLEPTETPDDNTEDPGSTETPVPTTDAVTDVPETPVPTPTPVPTAVPSPSRNPYPSDDPVEAKYADAGKKFMRKLKKTEGYEDLDIKGKYGYPYLICINRAGNTVTVYCIDEEGNYTRPYLSMVCSAGYATPRGIFKTKERYSWHTLMSLLRAVCNPHCWRHPFPFRAVLHDS